MNMERLNSNKVIVTGFALILVLLAGLISVWLWHIDNNRQLLNNVVQEHRESVYISLMRDAVQERVQILHAMYLSRDPFETDKYYVQFNQLAAQFIQARDQLFKMKLNVRERETWDKAKQLINNGQKEQQKVFDLLFAGKREEARAALVATVVPNQNEVIRLLTELLNLPLNVAHSVTETSYRNSSLAFSLVSLFGTTILIIGVGIALFVSRATRITEAKLITATEAAQKANHHKSMFLANMSHEIRTPLTTIVGFTEALLDRRVTEPERDHVLERILRNSRHLLHLINEILDISKIESKKMIVEKIEVNIFDLIAEVDSIASAQAQNKKLEFTTRIEYPFPTAIICDPVRLKQILVNLLSNAIKFTERGAVGLYCRYHGGQLQFDVTDTGIGIDPQDLQRLFQPFNQADSTTTRKYGGTGLGLSIAKELAELLGGNISVNSGKGKGSTFRLTLNLSPLPSIFTDTPPTENQRLTNKESFHTFSGRVVIAEDNADLQELAKVIFADSRIQLTVVTNGKDAVEKILSEGADLVLMDMQMPIMDGIEASQILRAAGFTNPIIALTANMMKEDIDRYRSIGINDFVGKPIESKQLFYVLNKFLPNIDSKQEITEMPGYHRLKTSFMQSIDQLINEYKTAIEKRDIEKTRFCAHKIKGAAGTFGESMLSMIASDLESAAKNQDLKKLQEHDAILDNWYRVFISNKSQG